MGSGAPKKVSAIPVMATVNIYAAEGMLYQASRELADVLKKCLEGSTDPKDWQLLDDKRREVVKYNMQYTLAIQTLIRSQKRA
jgi:hypothetical protein